MGSEEFLERIDRGRRWKHFLLRVGVKIGWLAPLIHWGTAIAVGVLVANDFKGTAATVAVFYLASCVYDAEGHVLRALFDAEERQAGHSIPDNED